MRTRLYRVAFVAAALAVLSAANADVPATVSYQGNLTDSGGSPLSGTYQMAFAIFTASSGGTQLWSETHPSVSVADGLFSVLLGSNTPIPDTVFNAPDRWLSITLNGTETIIPRTKLAATPYARRVGSVDGATGGTVSGNLAITGQLDPGAGIITPSGITIQSTGNNVIIIAGASQITVDPSGTVSITCANASINATTNLALTAGAKLSLSAPFVDVASADSVKVQSSKHVKVDAGIKTTIKGNSIETTASGTVDVNGALITLN